MRCLFLTANRLALCGVVLVCAGSTGCKSGWKMPGAGYLSFNKKVSEETLAGKGPSITAPVSPSTTQSPSLVAGSSKAAKPATGAALTNSSINPSLASATPSPYMPVSASTGQPSSAGVGAAASANGYATGPYSTYAQQQASNTYAPPAGNTYAAAGAAYNAAAANAYNAAATGAHNATSATYNAAGATAAPAVAAYGQVMQAANPPAAVPASVKSPATGSIASYGNAPAWGAPPAAAPVAKPAYPMAAPGGMYAQTAASAVAKPAMPVGYTGAAAAPANAYSSMPIASAPNNQSSMSTYNPVGGQAPASGYAMVPDATATTAVGYGGGSPAIQASTASFRPGSTQRTTGYDFSGATNSAVTGAVPTSTASGVSNPGYQLPPTGSLQR